MTTTAKTYGEAINDPNDPLCKAADACRRDRESVLADLAAKGITGEAAWLEILAKGLLRP